MPTSLRPPKALLSRLRSWFTRSVRAPITPSPSSLGSQQGSHGVLDNYLLRVLDNYLPGKKWVDGRYIYVLDYLSTLAERYPNSAMSLRAITRGKKGSKTDARSRSRTRPCCSILSISNVRHSDARVTWHACACTEFVRDLFVYDCKMAKERRPVSHMSLGDLFRSH